jgi:glycosyltransferase involved in cell wall biosynthesis
LSDSHIAAFSAHKCCVVIPTYNNEKTLERVIKGVLEYCRDVIIVNDGATDSSSAIIDKYKNQITLIVHPQNIGKGKALRNAFAKALDLGFDYAVTIDSDGQHYPENLPDFLCASQKNPNAIIMGSRNMDQASVPGKSSFGHKFSNFWFYVETGIKLPDTQTGFRLYPLHEIKKRKYYTNKFEFEIEVIVKMAWRFVQFESIPIKVLYDPNERVSHFRPFKDFTRISILNTYLVIMTFLWHLHVRLIRKIYKKGLWTMFKEELNNKNESNLKKACAIGFGIFMGIVPIWGFQMLVAAAIAKLLKLNTVITLVSSNISIPPMIPVLLFLSYWCGGIFLSDSIALTWNSELSLNDIYLNLRQYLIGSVIFATIAGLSMFLLSFFILKVFRKNTHK